MSSFLKLLWSITLLIYLSDADGIFDNIVNSFFGGEQGGHQGGQQVRRRGGRGRGRDNRPRTNDARIEIAIPLKELYLGSKRQISYRRNVVCTHCSGTGAEGGETKICRKCKGAGHIIVEQQVMPGFRMQQQKTCPVCGGKGQMYKHQCKHCHGKGVHTEMTSIDIDIEKGMRHGQEIRFEGKSEEKPGHITGDLIAVLKQDNHKWFERDNDHLSTAVELTLKQSLLGFDLNIAHLDEELVSLRHLDEITSHHQTRKYNGKGMPLYGRSSRYGDLFIEYRIKMPSKINPTQRKSLIDLFPELSVNGEYI